MSRTSQIHNLSLQQDVEVAIDTMARHLAYPADQLEETSRADALEAWHEIATLVADKIRKLHNE